MGYQIVVFELHRWTIRPFRFVLVNPQLAFSGRRQKLINNRSFSPPSLCLLAFRPLFSSFFFFFFPPPARRARPLASKGVGRPGFPGPLFSLFLDLGLALRARGRIFRTDRLGKGLFILLTDKKRKAPLLCTEPFLPFENYCAYPARERLKSGQTLPFLIANNAKKDQ